MCYEGRLKGSSLCSCSFSTYGMQPYRCGKWLLMQNITCKVVQVHQSECTQQSLLCSERLHEGCCHCYC
jgi:hypothetical protein